MKELVAVGDGYRESEQSWAEVLRDLKRRGMRAPVLAVGDGALGFWGALREVFLDTREQRCWVHRIANVLDALPKSLQPKAKGAGSRSAGLAMAYKLLEAAQARWRCVNAPHLVALVRAGATFVDGVKVEREDRRQVA
jgi:transposase-like protein